MMTLMSYLIAEHLDVDVPLILWVMAVILDLVIIEKVERS